ncbi:hypothetical protein HHL28_08860 [Aerophototrophica crusticola]|uniref:Uncharacterized protein n=1 Tax=Aerophototrophica crusticola TaxID=1709002 RepID=A0A858R7L6_9PROT|nr:hypothetical protein HHL28_08860 [Rhodospirillaceae bacterium B3]
MIGKPLSQVMQTVSIPTQREAGPGGAESLVWLQADRSRLDGSLIYCRETVTASNGVVTNYQRNGC